MVGLGTGMGASLQAFKLLDLCFLAFLLLDLGGIPVDRDMIHTFASHRNPRHLLSMLKVGLKLLPGLLVPPRGFDQQCFARVHSHTESRQLPVGTSPLSSNTSPKEDNCHPWSSTLPRYLVGPRDSQAPANKSAWHLRIEPFHNSRDIDSSGNPPASTNGDRATPAKGCNRDKRRRVRQLSVCVTDVKRTHPFLGVPKRQPGTKLLVLSTLRDRASRRTVVGDNACR